MKYFHILRGEGCKMNGELVKNKLVCLSPTVKLSISSVLNGREKRMLERRIILINLLHLLS